MGRQVRRVPPDWKHPTDFHGRYIPMEEPMSDWENEIVEWTPEQATHFMMYEDTSEGTPISPAFATPEDLARWLYDNGASAFASMTASYEQWLAVARGGFAPSAVIVGGALLSGVEACDKGATARSESA